ncbi:peptidoglycan recognition protein family protein [Streptomyces sp. NBC_00316]|uniref:peptidoglycan recognition protein family protein n=1 Tax=Streptomyces sp. NBC_00316 TaxID=2975710 RepID=UPI002E2998EB|nr:peptidoglycan recognition protein [Streptomyces sp. NBC_00316]
MRLYRMALWVTVPLAVALLAAPAGATMAGTIVGTTKKPASVRRAETVADPAADSTWLLPVLGAVPLTFLHAAHRPVIVSRAQWQADETKRDPRAHYAGGVTAIFIHHTDTPNDYECADVPRTLRNLYTGQTRDRDWGDIGYNFLVDKCGTIYEGRAGGVDRPVVGAHTVGFNRGTAGIAAIGTFGRGAPVPAAMEHAIAALAAWKLGLRGVDPRGRVRLTSTNDKSRYPKGTSADFFAISGHRDAYTTDCPGEALSAALPAIRDIAADLQGRSAGAPPDVGAPLTWETLHRHGNPTG